LIIFAYEHVAAALFVRRTPTTWIVSSTTPPSAPTPIDPIVDETARLLFAEKPPVEGPLELPPPPELLLPPPFGLELPPFVE
jgi:hypothetical protein